MGRNIEFIARCAHEANRAYCETNGGYSQVQWDEAPENIKESARNGVQTLLGAPELTPEQMHANWVKFKLADGWKYGPVKDVENKIHPCICPYDMLPPHQKIKDYLFRSVVLGLDAALTSADPIGG